MDTQIPANSNIQIAKAQIKKLTSSIPTKPTPNKHTHKIIRTVKKTLKPTTQIASKLEKDTIQPSMVYDSDTHVDSHLDTHVDTHVENQLDTWEEMFSQIKNADPAEITTDTLVGAALYSISAVEALEQMQARLENIDLRNTARPVAGCYSCGGILRTKDNVMICQQCGLEIQGVVVSTQEDECVTTSQDANVNDKGFISMKIIGKGAYGYNRNLLKNCADYTRYRKMTTLKEMHNWNSQSTGNQLPKNVINEANDMFATIKEHNYVFRKDVKKGVQGACLYYACHLNGISRTPAEIAKIVGIAEKFLSAGDRHLRDLNERGIISIPAKVDAIQSYVNRYFELLKIPDKYKQFVLDLIHQADDDRLHVQYDSKSNTKCIGTIFMLIDRIPSLRKTIDKERIEKECDISKTTFVKYYTMLCKFYRRFIHIFAKHKIPLKSEWREDIYSLAAPAKKPSKIIYTKRVYHTLAKSKQVSDPVADLIAKELASKDSNEDPEPPAPIKKIQKAARRYTRLVM